MIFVQRCFEHSLSTSHVFSRRIRRASSSWYLTCLEELLEELLAGLRKTTDMVEERMGDCWSHTKVWSIFNMKPTLLSGSSHVTVSNYQLGRVYVCVCLLLPWIWRRDLSQQEAHFFLTSQERIMNNEFSCNSCVWLSVVQAVFTMSCTHPLC